jgi:hypothetical protein
LLRRWRTTTGGGERADGLRRQIACRHGVGFVPVPEAGHFPHTEQMDRTLGAIGDFVDTVVKPAQPPVAEPGTGPMGA